MSDKQLTDEQIEALRAKHGPLYVIDLQPDDGDVVSFAMRAPVLDRADPKRDEFMVIADKINSGKADDDGSAELLALVVHPDPKTAQRHMSDYPSDIYNLRQGFDELTGGGDFRVDPTVVSEEQRAKYGKRAFGFSCGGSVVVARPISKMEFRKFVDDCGGKPHRPNAAALLTVAWCCVLEQPNEHHKKPMFEAIMQASPTAAIAIALTLYSATMTTATVRAKK